MAGKKILVVFGATGNQGGSVIKSILSDPKTASEFKIRGITRDPSKPNAQALTAKGVQCVAADINSKDQIKSALQGAFAVFAVTNYWEKMDAELETKQGRNVADLAKVFPFAISILTLLLTQCGKGMRRATPHLVIALRHYQADRRQIC